MDNGQRRVWWFPQNNHRSHESIAWNCQGLENPLTILYLKDIRRQYNYDILLLVETKHNYSYVQNLGKEINYAHSFVLPANGYSGGLAIFWNDGVKCSFVGKPTLHLTNMYITEGHTSYCLSYVYGNPIRQMRYQQWQRLISQAEAGFLMDKPRILLGDLNDIKGNEEKIGGPIILKPKTSSKELGPWNVSPYHLKVSVKL